MVAPVSVCMIVRNESAQLESCLKSIRPHVSEICIVDTGSDDSTPSIARRFADKFKTYTGCNDDQNRIADFSDARRESFSLATNPWVLWIDGDDEVRGADKLSSIVMERDSARGTSPAQVMFPYEYSHDHNGKVNCLHYRERLMSPRDAFVWQNAVHEVITCTRPGLIQTQSDLVTIVHKRNGSNKVIESGRNLRILKAMYEKHGESDARHLYYLGLEYGNNGDRINALKFLQRYVQLSGWEDERYMACLKIVDHYMASGDYEDAISWCFRATSLREKWGEAYFNLAKCYYFLANQGKNTFRNWEKCAHFARLGLSYPATKTVLFVNPSERDVEIYKYLNVALNNIGDVKGALDSVEMGLRYQPDEESLLFNKSIYDRHIATIDFRDSLDRLVRTGILSPSRKDLINKILSDKDAVTPTTQPTLSLPQTAHDHLSITIYVGHGVEPWNPLTVKTKGIGGSETAVIEMASRLSKLGHKVTVYGHLIESDGSSLEGSFDGVVYRDSISYGPHECDILLTSRRPDVVDSAHGVKAKATICWVHDVHCGSSLTHERALRIDRFLTLSNWHKNFFLSTYPYVGRDQVIVTRNGIDLTRFEQSSKIRNPHRAVYSSSPDRGMEVAVRIWPRVRQIIPDAELHVYYGFEVWEACSQKNPQQLNLIRHLKKLLEDHSSDGVFYHGRIDQRSLAKEYLESGVWVYPTWFSESSCITAMEAQAAGLAMVTSPIAALCETVGDRGVMIHGDWLSPEYQDTFVNETVKSMLSTTNAHRNNLRNYAFENFGWDSLAKEWDSMFRDIIDQTGSDIVPKYKAAR